MLERRKKKLITDSLDIGIKQKMGEKMWHLDKRNKFMGNKKLDASFQT